MSAALDIVFRPEALNEIYQLLEQESKLKAFFSVTPGLMLMRSSDASNFESSVPCLSVCLCE